MNAIAISPERSLNVPETQVEAASSINLGDWPGRGIFYQLGAVIGGEGILYRGEDNAQIPTERVQGLQEMHDATRKRTPKRTMVPLCSRVWPFGWRCKILSLSCATDSSSS
jgi:hypothetical protein